MTELKAATRHFVKAPTKTVETNKADLLQVSR